MDKTTDYTKAREAELTEALRFLKTAIKGIENSLSPKPVDIFAEISTGAAPTQEEMLKESAKAARIYVEVALRNLSNAGAEAWDRK